MNVSIPMSRRLFLQQTGGLGLAAAGTAATASGAEGAAKAETVRDRLWMFACATNSDFVHIGRRSVMSAAEGNYYFNVPNILIVQSNEKEAANGLFDLPFEPYTVALRPLKNVCWSVVGSGGFHKAEETAEVLAMAKRVPNFRGVMLDDFFTGKAGEPRAQLTVEELADVRRKLDETGRKLEIFATFYVKHFELPLKDYLDLIYVLTLWSMASETIKNIDDNLLKF